MCHNDNIRLPWITSRAAVAVLLMAGWFGAAFGGDTGDSAAAPLPPAVQDWPAAETEVIGVIEAYHEALTGGDIGAVEALVVPDETFVMLEGRHSNWGWPDYRDHHLAGELDDLSKVRFRLSFYRLKIDGSLAYATFAYEVLPKDGPEMNFGRGFATAVLALTGDGWKIQHLHTS
jgi:ketosteroid isomerase-like protein